MEALKGSCTKRNSLFGSWIAFAASLAVVAGLACASLPAEAAPAVAQEVAGAKTLKDKGTAVAVKDVEETGSLRASDADAPNCERSRKRLFVEGEGWIVRQVTTCY